jgi:adenylate cyclase
MASTRILPAGWKPPGDQPAAGAGAKLSPAPEPAATDRGTVESCAAYVELTIEGQPRRVPLDSAAVCRIGRSDQSAIVLPDQLASRHHAMIQHTEADEYHLIDLGSRNGTFVNNRRVTMPLILQPGDRITIGNHDLVFHRQKQSPSGTLDARITASTSTRVALNLRLITVLVIDIRDFTGLARRIDEATLAQTIGTFIRKAGTALLEQGTWTQKYIGDAVMAVWLHQKCAPEQAELLAVLQGLAKLAEIAGELQSQFALEAPIRIGAGINTGIASIGNVGSDAFADHTALGDVVNKAFRLESATKEIRCDVALGQRTYDSLAQTDGAAELFERHSVMLKGYQEPAQAFALSFPALNKLLALLRSQSAG